MPDPDFGTFTKNGITRTAESPEQRVRFVYEGWKQVKASAPPPRGGAGSGRDAWAAYANDNDVEVTPDMQRDDIIVALEARGVATVAADDVDETGTDPET
jgi:hypothetical protein